MGTKERRTNALRRRPYKRMALLLAITLVLGSLENLPARAAEIGQPGENIQVGDDGNTNLENGTGLEFNSNSDEQNGNEGQSGEGSGEQPDSEDPTMVPSNYVFNVSSEVNYIGTYSDGQTTRNYQLDATAIDGDYVECYLPANSDLIYWDIDHNCFEIYYADTSAINSYIYKDQDHTIKVKKSDFTYNSTSGKYEYDLRLSAEGYYRKNAKITLDVGELGTFADETIEGSLSLIPETLQKKGSLYVKYPITLPSVIASEGYAFIGWEIVSRKTDYVTFVNNSEDFVYDKDSSLARKDDYYPAGEPMYLSADYYGLGENAVLVLRAKYRQIEYVNIPVSAGEHGHFADDTQPGIVSTECVKNSAGYYPITFMFPEIIPDDGYFFTGYFDISGNEKWFDQGEVNKTCSELNEYKDMNLVAQYVQSPSLTVSFDTREYGTVSGNTTTLDITPNDADIHMYSNFEPNVDFLYSLTMPDVVENQSSRTFLGWKGRGENYRAFDSEHNYADEVLFAPGETITIEVSSSWIEQGEVDIKFEAFYSVTEFVSDEYELTLNFSFIAEGTGFAEFALKPEDASATYRSSEVTMIDADGDGTCDSSAVVFNVNFPRPDISKVPIDYAGDQLLGWEVDGVSDPNEIFANWGIFTFKGMSAEPIRLEASADKFDDEGKLTVEMLLTVDGDPANTIELACGDYATIPTESSNVLSISYNIKYFSMYLTSEGQYELFKLKLPEIERNYGYNYSGWKRSPSNPEVLGYYDENYGDIDADTIFAPGSVVTFRTDSNVYDDTPLFELVGGRIPTLAINYSTNATAVSDTDNLESLEADENGTYRFTYTVKEAPVDANKLSACWTVGSLPGDMTVKANGEEVGSGAELDEGTQITVTTGVANASSTLALTRYQDTTTVRKSVTAGMSTTETYTIKPGNWTIGSDGIAYDFKNAMQFNVASDGSYSFTKQ